MTNKPPTLKPARTRRAPRAKRPRPPPLRPRHASAGRACRRPRPASRCSARPARSTHRSTKMSRPRCGGKPTRRARRSVIDCRRSARRMAGRFVPLDTASARRHPPGGHVDFSRAALGDKRSGQPSQHRCARRLHRIDESRRWRDEGRAAADGDRTHALARAHLGRITDTDAALAARRASRRRAGGPLRSPHAAVARERGAHGRHGAAHRAAAIRPRHAAGAVRERPDARPRRGRRADFRGRLDSGRRRPFEPRARERMDRRRGNRLQRILRPAHRRHAGRGRHGDRARRRCRRLLRRRRRAVFS